MSDAPTAQVVAARWSWRPVCLALLSLVALVGFFLVPPIAQDQAYHAFADGRAWAGVPNVLNVASNLPFALVGIWGLLRVGRWPTPARASWAVFFAGVALVAVGSAYYHWAPSDASLVWDRVPMTLGFIGLSVALLAEWVGVSQRWLLPIGLALGVGSVLVWVLTEDLRLYYGVQLMPMVVAIATLSLYRAPYSHAWYLIVAVALYAAAKATEAADAAIYQGSGELVSGHTLKHLLAATATLAIFAMLRRRRGRQGAGQTMSRRRHCFG